MPTMQAQLPRAVKARPQSRRDGISDRRSSITGGLPTRWPGGRSVCTGSYSIPHTKTGHSELRHLIVERNGEAILDLRTQELATTGGFNRRMDELPRRRAARG